MNELKKLMQEVNAFSEERDWDQFHSPVNLAKSIAIEAVELLECYQWHELPRTSRGTIDYRASEEQVTQQK